MSSKTDNHMNRDNDQWVSYDNTNTLKQKLDYANGKCLGGIMIWAGSTDDASGSAILSLNDAAGRSSFTTAQLKATKDPIGQCVSSAILYGT